MKTQELKADSNCVQAKSNASRLVVFLQEAKLRHSAERSETLCKKEAKSSLHLAAPPRHQATSPCLMYAQVVEQPTADPQSNSPDKNST